MGISNLSGIAKWYGLLFQHRMVMGTCTGNGDCRRPSVQSVVDIVKEIVVSNIKK